MFLVGKVKKWVWPVWSLNSKFNCIMNEQMEQTDFLHTGANSGHLKVISMIFEWASSKMSVAI